MRTFPKLYAFTGIIKERVLAILDDDSVNEITLTVTELLDGMSGIDELLTLYRELE